MELTMRIWENEFVVLAPSMGQETEEDRTLTTIRTVVIRPNRLVRS